MGGSSYERDARRARAAYLGALRQLARAMAAFDATGVPLAPGPDGRILPWTPEHDEIMKACAAAWEAILVRRRAYEAAMRTLGRPASWPHA